MGPVASIASAMILARGVDHFRGGIEGGTEGSMDVLVPDDHLRCDTPPAAHRGCGNNVCLGRRQRMAVGLKMLSRSRVSLPCRISCDSDAQSDCWDGQISRSVS